MAAKNKTTETAVKVTDFINTFVENEQKKADSYLLIELMQQLTGFEPRIWGPSIIGFGSYHYKYAGGHEGDMPILGFSPRRAAFSLYVYSPAMGKEHLLEGLGKYKITKGCIYVNKLSDINIPVLEKICKASITYVAKHLDTKEK